MTLNIKSFLNRATSLSLNKQFAFFSGLGLSVILFLFTFQWLQTPEYSPLFSSLSSKDERSVIKLLDANSIPYKLAPSSGLILISESKLNNARMVMAEHGLPSTAQDAYELLTKSQGVYTSQTNEELIKKRVLEESIQNSIQTINGIQAASVQLALPRHTDFMQKMINPKASIVLRLDSGVTLTSEQVQAISYLVASSIPYMKPTDVTIVDQTGQLLNGTDSSPFALSSDQLKYRDELEAKLKTQILNVVAPILGRDNVRVQVNTALNFDVRENTFESYLPSKDAVQSEQIEKSSESNPSSGGGGVPGSLTNQPPKSGKLTQNQSSGSGGIQTQDNADNSKSMRDRETYNYSLGKNITHTNYAKGRIDNISVAVVLNDLRVKTPEGVEYKPLPKEEMEKITSLIRESVGFSDVRGDKISVVNERFYSEDAPKIDKFRQPFYMEGWFLQIIKAVLFLIGFIIFALFIWKPFYKNLFDESVSAEKELAKAGDPKLDPNAVDIEKAYNNNNFENSVSETKGVFQKSPDVAANVIKKWINSSDEIK